MAETNLVEAAAAANRAVILVKDIVYVGSWTLIGGISKQTKTKKSKLKMEQEKLKCTYTPQKEYMYIYIHTYAYGSLCENLQSILRAF